MLKRFLILLLFSFSLCYSQDVKQTQELTPNLQSLSSSIREELSNLKLNSQLFMEESIQREKELMTSLMEVKGELTISEQERLASQTRVNGLSTSLMDMIEKYESCYQSLMNYEVKLKQLKKVLLVLIIIFSISLLYKIVAIVLRVKGIKLPWILDLLG